MNKSELLKSINIQTKTELMRTLKNIDQQGFLHYTTPQISHEPTLEKVATLLSILNKEKVSLQKITLFEFGPLQHKIRIYTNDAPYNPGISQFFAHYKLLPYHCFDTNYNEAELHKQIQIMKANNNTQIGYAYNGLDLDQLEQDIQTVSANSFTEIQERIQKAQKQGLAPVLFSNSVLNAPGNEFSKEEAFWKEKRCIHIHYTNTRELGRRIRAQPNNPGDYKQKFKDYFEIEQPVNILLTDNGTHYSIWRS